VSDWTLHLGDCLDPVTGLASLPDKSVDHVITDPPYEVEAHTKQRRVKRGGVCETESLPFAEITGEQRAEVGRHLARVARRWILVFCQVEASVKWALALEAGGVEYVRTMVWIKPDAMPQFTGDRPGMGYESIVVAHPKGRKRWNGGGRTGVFVENKNAGRASGEPAPHPTTKPLPLIRELVDLFSDRGDLLLDPFAGSGTTGAACRQLGRNFIGWEINDSYHSIARNRINGDEAKPNERQPALF
jgi:DNA modification methylase